jgi:hypothetical protein
MPGIRALHGVYGQESDSVDRITLNVSRVRNINRTMSDNEVVAQVVIVRDRHGHRFRLSVMGDPLTVSRE